jgi:hypothetical protein
VAKAIACAAIASAGIGIAVRVAGLVAVAVMAARTAGVATAASSGMKRRSQEHRHRPATQPSIHLVKLLVSPGFVVTSSLLKRRALRHTPASLIHAQTGLPAFADGDDAQWPRVRLPAQNDPSILAPPRSGINHQEAAAVGVRRRPFVPSKIPRTGRGTYLPGPWRTLRAPRAKRGISRPTQYTGPW